MAGKSLHSVIRNPCKVEENEGEDRGWTQMRHKHVQSWTSYAMLHRWNNIVCKSCKCLRSKGVIVCNTPVIGWESSCHLCTGYARGRALTCTVEFSTATLMWPCGCRLRCWCDWRGNRQFSIECLAASGEGNIINSNIASVGITTDSLNQNL